VEESFSGGNYKSTTTWFYLKSDNKLTALR
jgi:hypothetical protein